jgi:hypothetical protein
VTGPVGAALPVALTVAAPHVPVGAAVYSTELNAGPQTKLADVPEQSFNVKPTALPPHAKPSGAPHVQAEHPRESLAPAYSNCFVPKGHV